MGQLAEYIGGNLKKLRLASRLSQVELAERVGIDSGQISRYESGVQIPREATLIKIADILDCEPEALLDGRLTNGTSGLTSEDIQLQVADLHDQIDHVQDGQIDWALDVIRRLLDQVERLGKEKRDLAVKLAVLEGKDRDDGFR